MQIQTICIVIDNKNGRVGCSCNLCIFIKRYVVSFNNGAVFVIFNMRRTQSSSIAVAFVVANKVGFYGKIRKVGEEFEIESKKQLGSWMDLVKAPAKSKSE